MPPLADREQHEAAIIADLEPVFEAQYRRAVASPSSIPFDHFEAELQAVMAADLATVFQSAGAAMILGLGIVLTAGAFEQTARDWADGFSRELAAQVVATSREKATDAVALAAGHKQKLREALAVVFLADSRLRNIAITETTRATSAGEHAVVIPYNADLLAGESEGAGTPRGGRSGVAGGRDAQGRQLIPIWRTSRRSNVCEHCAPLEGHGPEVWGAFYPMGSPAHCGCNCFLQWVEAAEFARRAA